MCTGTYVPAYTLDITDLGHSKKLQKNSGQFDKTGKTDKIDKTSNTGKPGFTNMRMFKKNLLKIVAKECYEGKHSEILCLHFANLIQRQKPVLRL